MAEHHEQRRNAHDCVVARCLSCGREWHMTPSTTVCNCLARSNLTVLLPEAGDLHQKVLASKATDRPVSLWRYSSMLPVDPQWAGPLSIGWSPLLDGGTHHHVSLFLKDETRQPSGSLKDRATEVVLAFAASRSQRQVIVASTGNAAASTACIGAARGFDVTVFIPDSVPAAKLAQIVAHGARVVRVSGSYDDAFNLAEQVGKDLSICNRSTGLNALTREGKKTCAFEIAEQLGWSAPDWIFVPTGDGNIISALGKGFRELLSIGLLDRTPRLVAAQAKGSNAIARAFRREGGSIHTCTLADSISVGFPRDAIAALSELDASNGRCLECSDEDIVDAIRLLARRFGVFAEPAGAVSYAAFLQALETKLFKQGESVVCLVTGSGLKDPLHAALSVEHQSFSIEPGNIRQRDLLYRSLS